MFTDYSAALATATLCEIKHEEHFLPFLDEFIEKGITPDQAEKVVAAGVALGVSENEIRDRLGDPVEQLRSLIERGCDDASAFERLVQKIRNLSDEQVAEMMEAALASENMCALAALMSLNMGACCANMGKGGIGSLIDAMGHKGIGGGTNLIRQWFSARHRMDDPVRVQIKAQIKSMLLDLAFSWATKGSGSAEQGLLSQQTTRPYRAGDDTDLLDIDATLDSLIASGRGLDALSEEDLVVNDTGSGRAVFVMLVDISGSMGPEEMAICAIAAAMLIVRVQPHEIAIALFESDTHVMKNLDEHADMDQLADELLEVQATGGTRIDAALGWAAEQAWLAPEAETKVLFLLSDFCFWEEPEEIAEHSAVLADRGMRFIGASHGYVSDEQLKTMVDVMQGEDLRLKNLNSLPEVLADALNNIAD